MARTEGQWHKGISFISPNEDVPVLLKNTYLNFGGSLIGEDGYGIRDNSGILQFKNVSGSWTNFGAGGGASTFLALTDTPSAYTDQAGKILAVNTGETAVEFIAPPSGSGDVVGPTGATADRIATFDGITGKLIQDGGKTIAEVLSTDNHTDGTTNKVYTATEKTKLSGIATGATANSADATLLARANHTGTQTASTISDFDTEVANNSAVVANTAKISFDSASSTKLGTIETNADVTDAVNVGSSIHGATAKTTPVDADTVPLIDSAASNVLKKVTWANIKATLKTYFDSLYAATLGADDNYVTDAEKTKLSNLSGTNTGDQTLPTRDSLGLDTDDSPQFAGVNVGHATDTTITRVSAGVVAVEGQNLGTVSITTTTSSATPTPTGDRQRNALYLTAQAANFVIQVPSGTAVQGNVALISIKCDATLRTASVHADIEDPFAKMFDEIPANGQGRVLLEYDGTDWNVLEANVTA
jgi:hypothetical protein